MTKQTTIKISKITKESLDLIRLTPSKRYSYDDILQLLIFVYMSEGIKSITKYYAKYKGFERINRTYLNKIDELFKRETGRSFYDLLKEEQIDGQVHPDAPKYRYIGCKKIHQDYDYDPKGGDVLLSTESVINSDKLEGEQGRKQ